MLQTEVGVAGVHLERVVQPVEAERKIGFVSVIIQFLNTGEKVVRGIRLRSSTVTPRHAQQVRQSVMQSKCKMLHHNQLIT